jgi:predicted metal-dependent hydrolase
MKDDRLSEENNEFEGMSHEELLLEGARRFNAGLFFEAHEAWEEVWLDSARELRAFYQGLIQVAAAFVHLQRNEYPGTVRLLHEGLRKLDAYPPMTLGVDLAALTRAARLTESQILEAGERGLKDIDPASLPTIDLASS